MTASPSPLGGPSSSSLVDAWQWQSTQPGGGRVSIVAADPSRYTINFQADGSLQVRADCNQVLGTYTVNGSSLMVQLGPSTLVACPPDSQVDAFLAGLGQVAGYSLNGADLELGLEPGGGQMLFTALPTPERAL